MFKKKIKEGRPTKDLKIDESKLSKQEKEGSGLKLRLGVLIFCVVILVIIIVLSIVVSMIKI